MKDKIVYLIDEFNPFNNGHIAVINSILSEIKPSKLYIYCAKKSEYKEKYRLKESLINLGLKEIKNPLNVDIELFKFKKIQKIVKENEFENYMYLNEFTNVKIMTLKDKSFLKDIKFIINANSNNFFNIIKIDELTPLNIKNKLSSLSADEDIRKLKSYSLPLSELEFIATNKMYFAKTVRSYYKKKRYIHALSVASLCSKIAQNNNLDINVSYICGYLHDIGKELAKSKEAIPIMNKYYLKNSAYPQFSWHQFIGEYIIKNILGVNDERITTSVLYHTTGRPDMSQYEKLVYCADKLDPLRGYDSSYFIKECIKDLNIGFVKTLKNNKEYLEDGNKLEDNPLTTDCYNYYLGE